MSGVHVHASCLVIGEAGVLLRGASGSGKSRLASELLVEARQLGWFARLVGDDRVRLDARHGRLVARSLSAIAGLLETRGVGIARVDHERAAVIRLVVDCSPEPLARLPEPGDREVTIEGVLLPRLAAPHEAGRVHIVLARLCGLHDTLVTD